VYDVIIVGSGPAGYTAAIYAARARLNTLVLAGGESGGQLMLTTDVENYPGFPDGIMGPEMMDAFAKQAERFGTEVRYDYATGVDFSTPDAKHGVLVGDERLDAHTVIIATGAEYRRLSLENLSRFEGAGVYYGATFLEAQLCGGEDVIVVGGGNSAGQAALFLCRTSPRVHIVIRGASLESSMSRYLIDRIEATPNIALPSTSRSSPISTRSKNSARVTLAHKSRRTWR